MTIRLFLVAGEPSGDRLGAAMMQGLKALMPDVEFGGIGGPLMQAEGMSSLFPMAELSLMGIAEIAPKYLHLKQRIRETANQVLKSRPDALITIDAPDFSLRVAKLVKAASDIPTVHYVAPTVWAWRAGRAEKMAQVIDHVLALFPFEPPLMRSAGMSCDFVGHPVVAEPLATAGEIKKFRSDHGIGEDPVILLLPGSRKGEVSRLTPIFGHVFSRLNDSHPRLRAVLPVAPNVAADVAAEVVDWPHPPILVDGGDVVAKRAAFGAADVALAASGTVSLELAAAATPMVIAYDMNWLTRQILKRMLLTDTVTLVNLVSESRTVPEFLGARCRSELIVPAIENLLNHPKAQQKAMALTMKRLGQGEEAPGLRAAKSVLGVIGAGRH